MQRTSAEPKLFLFFDVLFEKSSAFIAIFGTLNTVFPCLIELDIAERKNINAIHIFL